MGEIGIRVDTSKLPLKGLHPYDVEMSTILLSCLGILSSRLVYGPVPFLFTTDKVWGEFGLQIKGISFTNPFDIWGAIRSLPKDAIEMVLNRTLFYQHEAERRRLQNEILEQDLVRLKLDNLAKGSRLRAELIEGSIDPEEAMKLIGGMLNDQKAIAVAGNPKLLLPAPEKPKPTRPSKEKTKRGKPLN